MIKTVLSNKKKILILGVIFLLAVSILFSAVSVRANEAVHMLETYFTAEELKEDYFHPEVLAQLPVAELDHYRHHFSEGLGEFVEVEELEGDYYNVVFENGFIEMEFMVDHMGRVSGLFFLSVVDFDIGLEELEEKFSELPGDISLLVTKNGEELMALNPEEELAVASAFKIAVLKGLHSEIDAGNMSWEDTVTLEKRHKTLPTGQLQNWPDGSPLTLHTLASLMISVSDNTATDVLMDHIGREKIEEYFEGPKPVLTTREFFVLKNPENEDLREEYLAAEEEEKYEIIERTADRSLPRQSLFARGEVIAPEVEWFTSVSALEDLMAEVKDIDLMGINPGMGRRDFWDNVAYKGGSEPGVLNYTYWLELEDDSYFLSATWNNDALLDHNEFSRLFLQLLHVLD